MWLLICLNSKDNNRVHKRALQPRCTGATGAVTSHVLDYGLVGAVGWSRALAAPNWWWQRHQQQSRGCSQRSDQTAGCLVLLNRGMGAALIEFRPEDMGAVLIS
jgi:hypothetical protein